jgi:hypothetical protein
MSIYMTYEKNKSKIQIIKSFQMYIYMKFSTLYYNLDG